jgi:hypothetical protein
MASGTVSLYLSRGSELEGICRRMTTNNLSEANSFTIKQMSARVIPFF